MDALTVRTPASDAQAASTTLGAQRELPPSPFIDPIRIDRQSLEQMLQYCLDNGVDDLILITDRPWAVLWSEQVRLVGSRPLYMEEMENLLNTITNDVNAAMRLMRGEPVDFNYTMKVGRGKSVRFRCCATGCLGRHGRAGMHLVIRPAGKIPPTLDELGVPEYIKNACMPKTGIVLICGPTGSGKTTLLDSIIRGVATHPVGKHILTFYAPIENDLNDIPGLTGIIAQGEIGRPGYGSHLASFEEAVRNSLRRHPQVVVFGEARDRPTIEGAVLTSMTGHATYTTTHTSNVHMAIPRMADNFTGSDRIRITNGLIDNTRLIVHQRLLRRPDGIGRAPVRSALAFTQDIRAELLRTPIDQLPAAIHRITQSEGISLLSDAERQFNAGKIHENEMAAIDAEMRMEQL